MGTCFSRCDGLRPKPWACHLRAYYHVAMSADRIAALKAMLEQDPNSAFARYGLAIAYVNAGQTEEALKEFQTLLQTHPDYAAGYYHQGRALESLGRIDEARAIMERGIEVTTRIGDAHTRSELQAALDMLGI